MAIVAFAIMYCLLRPCMMTQMPVTESMAIVVSRLTRLRVLSIRTARQRMRKEEAMIASPMMREGRLAPTTFWTRVLRSPMMGE